MALRWDDLSNYNDNPESWLSSVYPADRGLTMFGAQGPSAYGVGQIPALRGVGAGGLSGGYRRAAPTYGGGGRAPTVAQVLGSERPFEGLGKTSLNLAPYREAGLVEPPGGLPPPEDVGLAEGMFQTLAHFGFGIAPDNIREAAEMLGGQLGSFLDVPLNLLSEAEARAGTLGQMGVVDFQRQAFERLPETPRKAQIRGLLATDPIAAERYIASYVRSHQGDLAQALGIPRIMGPNVLPGTNILTRAAMTLGIPQMGVARTAAGLFRSPEEVEQSLAGIPEDRRDPNLVELVRRYKEGELDRDGFLDELTLAGFPIGNDPFINMAFNIASDPLIIGGFVGGKAASAMRAGSVARLYQRVGTLARGTPEFASFAARETQAVVDRYARQGMVLPPEQASRQITNFNQNLTDELRRTNPGIVDEAMRGMSKRDRAAIRIEPAIRGIATASNAINNALDFWGPGRVGRAVNAYHSDQWSRGSISYYGPRTASRVFSAVRRLGGEPYERLISALGVENANRITGHYQGQLVRQQRALGFTPDPDAGSPTEMARAMGEVADPALQMTARRFTMRTAPNYTPSGVVGETAVRAHRTRLEGTASRKLAAVTGQSADAFTSLLRNAHDRLLGFVESAYWGHSIKGFLAAQRSAKEAVDAGLRAAPENKRLLSQKDWVTRTTLVGARELTQARAQEVLAAAERGDVAAVRTAVSDYDKLYANFSDPLDDTELLAKVSVWLRDTIDNDALVVTVGLDDLPDALADFMRANLDEVGPDDAYQIGIAPGEPWRVIHDEAGNLVGFAPWVDLLDDQMPVRAPTSLDQIRTAMFKPIRGDALLNASKRQFMHLAVAKHRLSRKEAERLFYEIQTEARRAEIQPRGLSGGQLWQALERVKVPTEVRNALGERGLMLLTAQAFEGNVMDVGLSVKFTGRSKTFFSRWGNFVGQIAEKVYPTVRFSLNPIFQLQEVLEPYFFNALRGIKPGWRWGEEDRAMLAMLDRYNFGDQFTDQAEYVYTVAQGWYNTTSGGFGRRQPLADRIFKATAGRTSNVTGVRDLKRLNYLRMVRREWGEDFMRATKRSAPAQWDLFQRHYETVDPSKIAMRLFVEKGAFNADDPDFMVLMAQATKPEGIGKRAAIRLDAAARAMDYPTESDLRRAISEGRLSEERFTDYAQNMLGWDPTYVARSWRVASGPTVVAWEASLQNAYMAGGMTKTRAGEQAAVNRRQAALFARNLGLSTEEFLAGFTGTPVFLSTEGQIPVGSFTQSVEQGLSRLVAPSGLPVRVYKKGAPEFTSTQARMQEMLATPGTGPTKAAVTRTQDVLNAGKRAAERKDTALPQQYRNLVRRNEEGEPILDANGQTQPEPVVLHLHEGRTPSVVFGEQTAQEMLDRSVSLLSESAVLDVAQWYDDMTTQWLGFTQALSDETVALFHQWFENHWDVIPGTRMADTRQELAARFGVGWGVTQQQTTVLDGMRYTMNAMDWVLREERIGAFKVGSVPEVDARVEAVMVDMLAVPDTITQKLYDFNDALAGRLTRTITNGEDGLQPAAIDVWMMRWLGASFDEKYVDELTKKFNAVSYMERDDWTGPAVVAHLDGLGVRLDKSASPTANQYEFLLRKVNEAKDVANRTNWLGRDDWTATEMQAVFWVAQQKATDYVEQSPAGLIAMAGGTVGFEATPKVGVVGDRQTFFPSRATVVRTHGEQAAIRLQEEIVRDTSYLVRDMIPGVVPTGLVRGSQIVDGVEVPSVSTGFTGADNQVEIALNAMAYLMQDSRAVLTQRPLYLDAVNAYPGGSSSGVVSNWALDWVLPEDASAEMVPLLQRYMREEMFERVRDVHPDDRLNGSMPMLDGNGQQVVRGVWSPKQRKAARGVKREDWRPSGNQGIDEAFFTNVVPESPEVVAALRDGTWVRRYDPAAPPVKVTSRRVVARFKRANAGEGDEPFMAQNAEALRRAPKEIAEGEDVNGAYSRIGHELVGAPLLERIRELGGSEQLIGRLRAALAGGDGVDAGFAGRVRDIGISAHKRHAPEALEQHQSTALLASDGSALRGGPVYYQRTDRGIRGALKWESDGRATLYTLREANAGTGIHELLHFIAPQFDESARIALVNARNDALFPRRLTPYERATQGNLSVSTRQYLVPSGRRAQAGKRFHSGISRTYADHRYGRAVTVKDRAFYDDPANRIFLSDDGLAGVAVTPDGDLVSVYKHPHAVVEINDLLSEAALYAKTLDGFDINGKLPDLYAQHGFRPAARVTFDPAYAPEGWDQALLDSPDVVLMVKDTEGVSGLPQIAAGGYAKVKDRVPVFSDWDDAYNVQQAAKAKVDAKAPKRVPGAKRGTKRAAEWNTDVEEWVAEQIIEYFRSGQAPNSAVQPIFNAFARVAKDFIDEAPTKVDPRVRGVFDNFIQQNPNPPSAMWNMDDQRVMQSLYLSLQRAEDQAHTTHYYRRGRSWLERSINHPYFGMYPASYMWGKVVPELTRFLLRKPFGVEAPFAGLAMANYVYEALQLQLQSDPGAREWLEKHPQTVRFLQLLVPGTPWEVPVNAPAWMRHYVGTELENQMRRERGLDPVSNDLTRIIGDTVSYAVGAGRTPITLGTLVDEYRNKEAQAAQQTSLANRYAAVMNALGARNEDTEFYPQAP